jgi:hypothetical protein
MASPDSGPEPQSIPTGTAPTESQRTADRRNTRQERPSALRCGLSYGNSIARLFVRSYVFGLLARGLRHGDKMEIVVVDKADRLLASGKGSCSRKVFCRSSLLNQPLIPLLRWRWGRVGCSFSRSHCQLNIPHGTVVHIIPSAFEASTISISKSCVCMFSSCQGDEEAI